MQDKSSNNYLNSEEILSLKQQSTIEPLRRPQKLRQVLINAQPSSSITMPI